LLFVSWLPAAGNMPVQNDRALAFDETIKTGETATWPAGHASEIVYFTDGSLEIAGKVTAVKRGESVFETAQTRTVKNTGASDVHYARIEFLGKGLPETWGTTGLSPNYVLLFENQYTRVYDIRIPAGTKEPQHTHHDRVVVCLNGAQLKHLMPDGREEPSTLKTGEIVWRKGGTHIGQNLGKTDLWVIAVEPK
jgi:quercetin dioxygenase-like cupin family protein